MISWYQGTPTPTRSVIMPNRAWESDRSKGTSSKSKLTTIQLQLHRNLPRLCKARRRIIIGDEEGGGGGDDYAENCSCARLEAYTEAVRSEVLLVHALLDGQQDQIIIFKGFSSSLVRRTSSDPTKPILPSRAIIKSIDRIRAPFNPSNIDYIQKDLSWDEFEELLKGKQL